MGRFSLIELKNHFSTNLSCFPVTHSTPELEFDKTRYVEHLELLAGYRPSTITAPGGTGEFFSLRLSEVAEVLRTAVSIRPEHSAVFGSAGYGTSMAIELARDVEDAGADGLFLLPPYLTEFDQCGLIEHVKRVCAATSLGVLVYHRDRARFTLESVLELADSCPNFIAFKDGVGDIDLMTKISVRLGDRLALINGMPTAEISAAAYLATGCHTYSSAVFNFLPEWALSFYRAVTSGNSQEVARRLDELIIPLLAIRGRRPGYAVSIVKAGMRAVNRSAGPVRPPLIDLSEDELREVVSLVQAVG